MLLAARDVDVRWLREVSQLEETADRTPPDLVLIDGITADANGEACIREIRRLVRPDVDVLVFSARPFDELRATAARVHADGCISKADPPRRILAEVMSALERPAASTNEVPTTPPSATSFAAATVAPRSAPTALSPPGPVVTVPPSSPGAGPVTGALRILLIDDSEVALAVNEHHLRAAGFDVRMTLSVGEFEALLDGWSPHVVLMDIQMPQMSGDELCRRVKDRFGAKVPVILVSDMPPAEIERRACAGGADAFVSKTSGPEILVEYVRSICAMVYSPDALP